MRKVQEIRIKRLLKLTITAAGCNVNPGFNMSELTQAEPLMTVTEDAARQVALVRSKEPEKPGKTLRVSPDIH